MNAINNFSYNDINKKNNIPKLFYETNDLIFNEISEKLSDFEKAKTIAIWLKKQHKRWTRIRQIIGNSFTQNDKR